MARQPKTAPPKQKFNKLKCILCNEEITVAIENAKLVLHCACGTPTV